jgi:hypothetical protein
MLFSTSPSRRPKASASRRQISRRRTLSFFGLPYGRAFDAGQSGELLQGQALTFALLFQPFHGAG